MLSLDQIKQLEARVSKALELIQSLKDENDLLKLELHDRQKRIDELENIVLVFRNDQAKIEEGIINALNHLSAFEDTVYQAANSTAVSSLPTTSGTAVGELSGTSAETSDVVTTEQLKTVHEGTTERQLSAAVSESVPQPATAPETAPQETANHSNQLDIF